MKPLFRPASVLAGLVGLCLVAACAAPPTAPAAPGGPVPVRGTSAANTISQPGQAAARLRLGDTLGAMRLSQAPAHGPIPSIWLYCSPRIEGAVSATECSVPALARLSLGYDSALQGGQTVSQSELVLDGRPVDLNSFGQIERLEPSKGFNGHSEVFHIRRAWNVALESPAPGPHNLRSVVQGGNPPATFELTVNFTVAGSD